MKASREIRWSTDTSNLSTDTSTVPSLISVSSLSEVSAHETWLRPGHKLNEELEILAQSEGKDAPTTTQSSFTTSAERAAGDADRGCTNLGIEDQLPA